MNFAELYRSVEQRAFLPGGTSVKLAKNHTVIRSMYVDLGALQRQLNEDGLLPTMVTICADVVHLPDELTWTLNKSSLTVLARRVEAAPTAKIVLDFRSSTSAVLQVFAHEFAAPLHVHTLTQTETPPTPFSLSETPTIGAKVYNTGGVPALRDLTELPSKLVDEGTVLHHALVTEFLYATVLLEDQPHLSAQLLAWIRSCSTGNPAFAELYVQSSALLVLAHAQSGNIQFVPYLSPRVYTETIRAYVATAKDYERQYNLFQDRNADLQARIEAAKEMTATTQDETRFTQQLISQCQNNFKSASLAVQEARTRFERQQNKVKSAEVRFKLGLIDWEHNQKWKAALAIFSAVFEFTGAVASIAVTAGAATPAAATAGAQAVAATAQVAQTASSLAKTMEQLSKALQTLDKLFALAMKIQQIATGLSLSGATLSQLQQISFETPSEHDITGVVFWKQYLAEVETQLRPAIQESIGGAAQYKLQMELLALQAEDLLTKQVSLIQISQELMRLKLQQETEETRQKRLERYIEELVQNREPNEELMQALYWRYLQQKVALFVSLQHYQRAYKYWALSESGQRASITDKVDALESKLTHVQIDYQNALESFAPSPQPFQEIVHRINAPEVLQALREERSAVFALELSQANFRGFDRVRVRTIRVELVGAACQSEIYVQLVSSGTYLDRFQQRVHRFVTAPLVRGIVYDPATDAILLDGTVADETQFAYFEPTPFTEWKLILPTHDVYNQGLDLTKLTHINLKFSGSLIISR